MEKSFTSYSYSRVNVRTAAGDMLLIGMLNMFNIRSCNCLKKTHFNF